VSLNMDLAFRNAAASLVPISVVSYNLIAVAAADAAAVDLCNFVVEDELDADVFASNLRFHPENKNHFHVISGFSMTMSRLNIPDNNVDHYPVDSYRYLDNNYYSYFDIEAIGSCTDHLHSNHHFQCQTGDAIANCFVVSNCRRRHYLMPMPTHDALKFLVVNIDASVGCRSAVMVDFLSLQHYEPALVLVVCLTYRVDSVMLSEEDEEEREENKVGT
jgi:hypothetical protein